MKKFSQLTRFSLFLSVFAVALFLGPDIAHAQVTSLGGMFCEAVGNIAPLGLAFQWMAYGMGVFFILTGIHHFHSHTHTPHNHPHHKSLSYLGGGTLLLAFPSAAHTIITSIYPDTGGTTPLSCTDPGVTGGGQTLDKMLSGFVSNIKMPLGFLISTIAIVVGIWMLVEGFSRAAKYGHDPKSNSIPRISASLAFGALLVTVGSNLQMILASLFGNGNITIIDQGTVLSWGFVSALGGGSDEFATAVSSALIFFQLIGLIAFVRGWMILKKVVEGGGNESMAKGITHICGGALAANIAVFLKIMDTTFGTNML